MKVLEDSMVDSPPSRSLVQTVTTSSSPLKGKARSEARILNSGIDLRSIQKLYDLPISTIRETLEKVPSILLL
jgi:hypothetical protein